MVPVNPGCCLEKEGSHLFRTQRKTPQPPIISSLLGSFIAPSHFSSRCGCHINRNKDRCPANDVSLRTFLKFLEQLFSENIWTVRSEALVLKDL